MDKPRRRTRWVIRERWHRRARLAGLLGGGLMLGLLVEDLMRRGGGIGVRTLLAGLVTVGLGAFVPWWLIRWIGRRVRYHQFDR